MDSNLCDGNEKGIDNEIRFKSKKNENLINTINKNDDNKIENNKIIYNKKEIIKQDKDKNNKKKNITKNKIEEVENIENKKNKAINKNEYVNNKINSNNNSDYYVNLYNNKNFLNSNIGNRFDKKYLDEEKEKMIIALYERTLELFEEINKKKDIKYHSLKQFLVLEKINIFNSVLIILNNISFIKDYFSSNIDNIINICELKNTYCLTSITYYINQYLWKIDEYYLKISGKDLTKKYIDFITYYSEANSKDKSLAHNFCYDPQNAKIIFKFIFNKINSELTSVNGPKLDNTIYNNFDPLFLSNINKINEKYNSILSEHMMGLYEYRKYCDYCMLRAKNYNSIYNYEYQYEKFYEITFNLNEIIFYYKNKNSQSLIQMGAEVGNNNEKQNINLEKCFNYTFIDRNRKAITEFCRSCNLNTNKSQYNLIYSPPNILTLILVNNEKNENCNFIIQDEINIKKYIFNSKNDRIYLLISCLCRLSNTGKYICYCINPEDSYWYSYSDKKINKVEKIDEYAVPLILFYQSISTMNFEYKKITIVNEVILTIKFTNGIEPKKMSFYTVDTIKSVIGKILSSINLKGAKGKLLINGEKTIENEILSKYLLENNNVLLII